MDEPRRSPLGLGITIAGVALLGLYSFSIGPVGWVIIQCGSPAWTRPAFELVYGPLIWLQDFGPAPISKLLTAYLAWWW